MDRLIREKVNKETENLNNRKYQLNLTDITLHPKTNSRVHILLNCTRNILHDGSDVR